MNTVATLNSATTLEKLRTTYRVRAPRHHALVRAAKKLTKVPVVYFRTGPRVAFGNAPEDLIYENSVLYMGPKAAKNPSSLWHDLCHAMVATEHGKMNQVNFGSSDAEEVLTCKIELWLGFMAGLYTYHRLVYLILDYNFEDSVEVDQGFARLIAKTPGCASPESVENFLLECRKEAQEIPLAKQLATELEVNGVAALKAKMAPFRKKYGDEVA